MTLDHLAAGTTNTRAVIRREAEVTWRMMADNASTTVLPPLLFTAAAGAHFAIDGSSLVARLAVCAVQFGLYHYIFDASNQARGAVEDAVNKPHRPIPRGLITPRGAMRRFWFAMPLYSLLGWLTGTLEWVLLWQVVVVVLNLVPAPRYYNLVKPVAIVLGTIAQLAAAWQLVGPLDAVGWTWVLTMSFAFNLPLPFEDLRDVDGDRAIGRRTLALTVGERPVRIGFAVTMCAMPVVLHLLLFAPTGRPPLVIASCDAVVVVMSWTAAVRALVMRGARADRVTYLLFTFVYCVELACGIALL